MGASSGGLRLGLRFGLGNGTRGGLGLRLCVWTGLGLDMRLDGKRDLVQHLERNLGSAFWTHLWGMLGLNRKLCRGFYYGLSWGLS